SFELRLAHCQRLRIRDIEGNLLGSSSKVGSSGGIIRHRGIGTESHDDL
ncbi:hypothetical protein LINGRAHAP2_LOCUS24154, partial [Linum grandiflorum]